MDAGTIAIDVVLGLVKASPAIAEVLSSLAGTSEAEVVARLERARAAIRDPIDPTPADTARRARLERILRGEGA